MKPWNESEVPIVIDDIDGDGIRPPDDDWELFDAVVEDLEF